MQLIGILLNLVIALVKPVFKIIVYTGLYIPIILLIGSDWLLRNYFKMDMHGGTIADKIVFNFMMFGLVIAALVFIRNVVRTVTSDPSKGIFWFIPKRKPKAGIQATTKDIAGESGVVFGKKDGRLITKKENTDGHILVIGGAGSGKSSCIAIPSLLNWKERVFAIDIKGELNKATGSHRESSVVFAPALNNGITFDPFKALQNNNNLVQDSKEIAQALIPIPEDIKDPFWIKSAQNLLTGAILHYSQRLDFVDTMIKIQSTPVNELITDITNSDSQEARMFVNQLIGLKSDVVAGIFTELSNKIMTFATDPDLKRALKRSSNSISPQDIENGKDIYINIPEDKLEQWKELLTLITNQFLKHFERRKEGNEKSVLFLLDEFARLGKIPTIQNGLATLRSKKITICILTQSLAQIDLLYSEAGRKIIADNCQYKAILKATDADTQEYFSKLIGTYEKEKLSHNANFEQYTGLGKGTGKSKTTEEKRIIKPEEFAYLQDIVLLTPSGYTRVEKTPYYLDKTFTRRQTA